VPCFQRSLYLLILNAVIMSFETARKDIELIDTLAWSIIVVDEAHRIKNPDSDLTQAFAKFRSQMRIGLTGTAIQNGYEEFWTILDWVNPGAVGQADEWKTVRQAPFPWQLWPTLECRPSQTHCDTDRVRRRLKKSALDIM
jgi:hypothetical protein